ncbi:adenylyl-sulfate kinase [Algibacter sp. 2305UL17-15]|uniref:adenylyl-sulfate kinase n=1 Tax=Algibacter sp. 2305UL17-15 TaxID=3231268 RepID=UPI003459EA7B
MCTGKAIWLFGLSGAGKTTLSTRLLQKMKGLNKKAMLLDGDILRKGINSNLGFSKKDRNENVRRIAEICKLLLKLDVVPIVAAITPYEKDREMVLNILGRDNISFIYIECPVLECEKRDPKQLYKRARTGQIKNFTGVSDVFEVPVLPHQTIATANKEIEECTAELFRLTLSREQIHGL